MRVNDHKVIKPHTLPDFNPPFCGMGHTEFTTYNAHDVIAITSLRKSDLCTEELRDV